MSRVRRSFFGTSTPIAFAHRGGGGEAPENTLPAFNAAFAMGYRYLETDVQLTSDGVLLAFHDSSLNRLTDRVGKICQLTLDEVREADAGYAFSPDGGLTYPFRGTGIVIPTLEELLSRWDDVYLNIDAKAYEISTDCLVRDIVSDALPNQIQVGVGACVLRKSTDRQIAADRVRHAAEHINGRLARSAQQAEKFYERKAFYSERIPTTLP